MRPILAVLLAVSALPALAQDWVAHEFGELRAHHGDWLAVCDDEGAGPCRAVQSAPDPGSKAFFDQRIAVHQIDGTPDWAIEIMDRGMQERNVEALTFVFDGEAVAVPPGAWQVGDLHSELAGETVTVIDKDVSADLVTRMKAGRRLLIQYEPQGTGDGEGRYSLRGITAATKAIEARVLARQD